MEAASSCINRTAATYAIRNFGLLR